MGKKTITTFFILLGVLIFEASAQDSLFSFSPTDTILLTDGSSIITSIIAIDTSNTLLSYRKAKNPKKVKSLYVEDVYSITDKSGERIIYTPDSSGENYSVEEMRYLILGQQDGNKTKFAYIPFLANFLVSGATSVTGSFFSPVVPLLFTGVINIPEVKIRDKYVSDPSHLSEETYVIGYKQAAYKKRKLQTLLGGGIGFLAGITTSFILKANGINFSYTDLFSK